MEKTNNKNLKISFIINILVVIMTIVTLTISLTRFKFMKGYEPVQQTQFFNYFTVQSNTFMGIVSFIFAIKEFQVLKGTKEKIPVKYRILKMIATIAVSLTFFVVFACMSFVTEGGILSLIRNSNLFYHLIIPATSIINFLFFEKTDTIKFKYTVYGLIPTELYEIYYIINIILNTKNGEISATHDWYYFLQNGVWSAIVVAPMMLGITYIISLTIWKLNKPNKKHLESI